MANIKDIAKKAGVSVATVSRVINNKSDVSETMRKYIMKIMDDVGYVPNAMAKNLSHGRSNMIAVMLPTLDTPFFSDLLTEIEREANKNGYNILLFNSSDSREKVDFYLNLMKSHFVCGAIINSLVITKKDIDALEKSGIRTVTVDRTPDAHAFSSIKVDHQLGGQIATRHLIESGCRKLLMVSGHPDDKIAQFRSLGYLQENKDKLGCDSPQIIHGDLTSPGGYSAMLDFLKASGGCDGVFCANDAMVFGAIRACADYGLNITEDVIFIGYDNSSLCEYYLPAISSVDQRLKEVGILSVKTIIDLIQTDSEPVHLTVLPQLVKRESTRRFLKHQE